MANKPIILAILDGYGFSENKFGNAITSDTSPFIFSLIKNFPTSYLEASGSAIGLPDGQIGNSEIGHLTIGAGRVVYNGLSLINKEIQSGEIANNKIILEAINFAKKNNSHFHILGLLSDGGVHSNENHIFELIKIAAKNNIVPIVHIFGDGRDVNPKSLLDSLTRLNEVIKNYPAIVATVSGRFYAMDRDKRWERITLAYNNLLGLSSNSFSNISEYISSQYEKNITDEFIEPAHLNGFDSFIKDNDSIIFANFRPDRARELSHFIFGSNLYQETPENKLKNIYFAIIMPYEGISPSGVLYETAPIKNTLGEIISKNNLSQLRIAETEKYAHVTFFMDGGLEVNFNKEKRILIPSPKVNTYDESPNMSAIDITDILLKNIREFDFIILNFANADMVGHTGNFDATLKSIKCLDEQVKRIYESLNLINGTLFITADHGNAEEMIDDNNLPITKHSINLVPLIITDHNVKLDSKGSLANIAPTILDYMNIDIPSEMSAKSLLKK
ncbi:MAG: 2,3-bisphosphoglycerate-independent phosphoglycerate mutase [Malacoplasma sp.]